MEAESRFTSSTTTEVEETILSCSFTVEGGKERRGRLCRFQVPSVGDQLVALTMIRKLDTAPDNPMGKQGTCSSALEDTV